MPGKLSAAADRVIVVGGSEGAIETLIEIAKRLPPRFRSPIFVVIHQPTTAIFRKSCLEKGRFQRFIPATALKSRPAGFMSHRRIAT